MSNTPRRTPAAGRPTAAARARQAKLAPPAIKFKGAEYRIADKIGVWPLMQLARAAQAGVSLADQRGLAATHALMQDVIHPDDWGRFEEDMIVKKVDDMAELMEATRQATELMAERQQKKGRANGKVVAGELEE
jgi:hypothetical protein